MEEYRKSMEGVWSSCINERTIDESPMAYKNPKEIIENTKDTFEIYKVLKPIYSFKDDSKKKGDKGQAD
jgi:hypothetical protein